MWLRASAPLDTRVTATNHQLGEFLRSRRARLQPADAGVPTYGERRRLPGLRREEPARLAGVSAPYYARLEQGQSAASPEVLDALAGALRLDDTERRHLPELAARPGPGARRPSRSPRHCGNCSPCSGRCRSWCWAGAATC
ncbi:XRE family transcriptional regulator [Actinoplanes sp. N902-109]|nr:XRE family transcriptional regulator [Actinoplanes sp. N902-109]